MTWGYKVPDDSPAAWGARAIATNGYMDLLPDRQAMTGTEEGKALLLTLLNDAKLLEIAQAKYKELRDSHEIRDDQNREVVLYEDELVRVHGNTNASYGYFYVSAYLKADGQATEEEMGRLTFEQGPEHITWSHKVLPLAGDKVRVNGDLGACKVVGHHVIRYPDAMNFLFLVVRPLDPPDWWVAQAKRNSRPFIAHIMGREWEPLEE